jgi:large subunit ribosomal protein L2
MNYLLNKLDKDFRYGVVKSGGRNFLGRVCVNGRGGGNKKKYRVVDYLRRVCSMGRLLRISYDSFRSAFLGLLLYNNGLVSYIILSNDIFVGNFVYSGIYSDAILVKDLGWAVPLSSISLFSVISNIELEPYKGAKLARSAGVSCILTGREKNKAIIKLRSGWQVSVSEDCIASLGPVSNPSHRYSVIGCAGKKRALGFRPKVRGVAKNPCDHPHGGGNGKKSSPVVPVSAWGRIAKWTPSTNTKLDKKRRRAFKIIS